MRRLALAVALMAACSDGGPATAPDQELGGGTVPGAMTEPV